MGVAKFRCILLLCVLFSGCLTQKNNSSYNNSPGTIVNQNSIKAKNLSCLQEKGPIFLDVDDSGLAKLEVYLHANTDVFFAFEERKIDNPGPTSIEYGYIWEVSDKDKTYHLSYKWPESCEVNIQISNLNNEAHTIIPDIVTTIFNSQNEEAILLGPKTVAGVPCTEYEFKTLGDSLIIKYCIPANEAYCLQGIPSQYEVTTNNVMDQSRTIIHSSYRQDLPNKAFDIPNICLEELAKKTNIESFHTLLNSLKNL